MQSAEAKRNRNAETSSRLRSSSEHRLELFEDQLLSAAEAAALRLLLQANPLLGKKSKA